MYRDGFQYNDEIASSQKKGLAIKRCFLLPEHSQA